MAKYIANAFSLAMLKSDCSISVKEVSLDEAIIFLKNGAQSAIGHQSTAEFVTMVTGVPTVANRIALSLVSGDKLLVLQLLGRLPEGAVLTQEDLAKVPSKWYLVEVL